MYSMQSTEISRITSVWYPDRTPTPVLQSIYGDLKVSISSGAGRPLKQEVGKAHYFYCANEIIRSSMNDEATIRPAPKNIIDALHVFPPLSELQQSIQLVSHSPLKFYSFFFCGFFFKFLGAEPRISMCHNNHVYLFPAPVCSIISYQLNLASTWCSSLTSPVRNPICSSLCDAREIWKGEKKKNMKERRGS